MDERLVQFYDLLQQLFGFWNPRSERLSSTQSWTTNFLKPQVDAYTRALETRRSPVSPAGLTRAPTIAELEARAGERPGPGYNLAWNPAGTQPVWKKSVLPTGQEAGSIAELQSLGYEIGGKRAEGWQFSPGGISWAPQYGKWAQVAKSAVPEGGTIVWNPQAQRYDITQPKGSLAERLGAEREEKERLARELGIQGTPSRFRQVQGAPPQSQGIGWSDVKDVLTSPVTRELATLILPALLGAGAAGVLGKTVLKPAASLFRPGITGSPISPAKVAAGGLAAATIPKVISAWRAGEALKPELRQPLTPAQPQLPSFQGYSAEQTKLGQQARYLAGQLGFSDIAYNLLAEFGR